jgi:DNA-binding NarL/FixJ family response regulator
MESVRVLIADAQCLFADALGAALAAYEGLAVLNDHPHQGIDALQAATRHHPHVVLLDYWLPDMHAPQVIRQLHRDCESKVVVLSWFHGPDEVQATLEAGGVGFMPKTVRVPKVAEAVRRAHEGEDPVFGEKVAQLVGSLRARAAAVDNSIERFSKLTGRELQALQLLARGATIPDIAHQLEISHATARTHVGRVLHKTEASSQLEAVVLARVAGLVH